MFSVQKNRMMKHGDINKLSELHLVLNNITVSLKEVAQIEQKPIYRVELWLDNIIIDDTADIISSVDRHEKCLKLAIGSAHFSYKAADLFGRHKVARLKIRLMRCALFTDQQDLLDQYHLALSQYAYEYCKQSKNTFKQHLVGHIRRSFLHYTIHCTYKQMQDKENQILSSIPQLKRNSKSLNESNSEKQKPLINILQGILPIDSIQKEDFDAISQGQQHSRTYISKNRLMPVFRSDNFAEDKIKIKLSYSFTNFDDNIPAENSVIAETNKISEKLSILKSFLFYGFMVVSLLRIVYLMEPTSKV